MSEQLSFDFREYDLPPMWDGKKVTWSDDWEVYDLHVCPPPKDKRTCTCGSTKPMLRKQGEVGPYKSAHRAKYNELRTRPLWRSLTVFRCSECELDTVLDFNGDFWELGLEDYGDQGSHLIDTTSL